MTGNAHESRGGVNGAPQQNKRRGLTLVGVIVTLGILCLVIAFLLPATRSAREPARRAGCRNNLHNIGLALYNYQETYGAFPPAYTVDAQGKPLHSWRTLILPYLDQKQLYDKIDLSKPWNDPANAEAYKSELSIFRCPSAIHPPNHTVYLAVVTPNSCLRPAKPRPLSEITDGSRETVMVIEMASDQAVHWMAPEDANEQMVLGFGPDTELPHVGGTHALYVDTRVQFLASDTMAALRRALISIAGNDKVTD